MNVVFDLDKLTLGDMADLEEIAGVDVFNLDRERLTTKQTLGLIWVTRRQDDPTFTYEQARRLKPSDLNTVEEVPTEAVEVAATTLDGDNS